MTIMAVIPEMPVGIPSMVGSSKQPEALDYKFGPVTACNKLENRLKKTTQFIITRKQ